MITETETAFLAVIRAFLTEEKASPAEIQGLTEKQWNHLFVLAAQHSLLSAVYDVVGKTPEFAELPETYVDAVLSVEDHRFYGHIGIDPIAITRAVINDIRAGAFVEGGSTITQQLAKNLYFTQEKKMERKAAEVFMAFALEKEYSKNEILELYVNTIYFGNGYYCIKDASEGYFGKAPEDMDDYESTLLAGVPNAPSKYAPTVNPALAAKRQEQVLERLVECGLFTEKRARETMAETREYQEPDAA